MVADLIAHYKLETVSISNETVVHSFFEHDPDRRRRPAERRQAWSTVRRIGKGASGVVYLQREEYEDKNGALAASRDEISSKKELRALKKISKSDNEGNDRNALRELLSVSTFAKDKTNFPVFFGWFEDVEHFYIAMEYFEHGDLFKHLMNAGQPVSERQAQDICFQIALALTEVHKQKITHRDVRPQNILIVRPGPEWLVKLGDFGISKRVLGEETGLHTEFYGPTIAPEIIGLVDVDDDCVSPYTSAVDVWALGCLAHWLVTLKPLFFPINVLSRYCKTETLPLDTFGVNTLSGEGISFVKSCLKPQYDKRPAAADALDSCWLKRPQHDYYEARQGCQYLDVSELSRGVSHAQTAVTSHLGEQRRCSDTSHRQGDAPAMLTQPMTRLSTPLEHTISEYWKSLRIRPDILLRLSSIEELRVTATVWNSWNRVLDPSYDETNISVVFGDVVSIALEAAPYLGRPMLIARKDDVWGLIPSEWCCNTLNDVQIYQADIRCSEKGDILLSPPLSLQYHSGNSVRFYRRNDGHVVIPREDDLAQLNRATWELTHSRRPSDENLEEEFSDLSRRLERYGTSMGSLGSTKTFSAERKWKIISQDRAERVVRSSHGSSVPLDYSRLSAYGVRVIAWWTGITVERLQELGAQYEKDHLKLNWGTPVLLGDPKVWFIEMEHNMFHVRCSYKKSVFVPIETVRMGSLQACFFTMVGKLPEAQLLPAFIGSVLGSEEDLKSTGLMKPITNWTDAVKLSATWHTPVDSIALTGFDTEGVILHSHNQRVRIKFWDLTECDMNIFVTAVANTIRTASQASSSYRPPEVLLFHGPSQRSSRIMVFDVNSDFVWLGHPGSDNGSRICIENLDRKIGQAIIGQINEEEQKLKNPLRQWDLKGFRTAFDRLPP